MEDQRQDDRLREVIERLRDEDSRQNHRLTDLESAIREITTKLASVGCKLEELEGADRGLEIALVGTDGNNGIRGTMIEHYEQVHKRIDKLEVSVDSLAKSVASFSVQLESLIATIKTGMKIGGALATIITVIGVIFGIVHSL